MGDLDERDLRKLFRSAGHHHPQQDLTDRIMARVTVTRSIRTVQPVIGMRGWAWVVAGMALLLVLGMIGGTAPPRPAPLDLPQWLQVVQQEGARWASWLAAAGVLAFGFTAIDTILRTRTKAVHR